MSRLWKPYKLSHRVTLVFSFGVLVLAAILGGASEVYLRRSLEQESSLRGLALARSLASVARPYLLHYDYIALQQMADAVTREPEVAYVVILDKEGKVGGFGGRRDLQGKRLDSLANQRALSFKEAGTQDVRWTGPDGRGVPVIEAIAPMRLEEESGLRWGTVRVGLSIARVHQELWRARTFLLCLLLFGVMGALVAGTLLARRITRPLSRLVLATSRPENDTFDPGAAFETGDEVEALARRFAESAQTLGRNNRELRAAKSELVSLNANLELEVERRTAELSGSREQYRLLIEGSSDAFMLMEGGRFVFLNSAFCTIFGYPQEVALTESFRWNQIIHPNFHRMTREHFREAEETATGFHVEVVGLTRSGRALNLEVRGRSVRLRGRPVLELVMSDMTEKRRLLKQVVQSERLRAMGEMTAMVAHHFNNLLAIMLGRCQLLQMRSQDATVKAGLEVIQSSALRAGEMLRHLQEYYGEQVDLRFGEVDLNNLLRELAAYQENIWRTTRAPEAPHVSIRLELGNLPVVRGSDPLLQDALRRILHNSADALPHGGEIVIHTEASEHEVLILVEDCGVGMSSEVLAHAFEPFYTTKGPKTRGLGLSAALGIVQRHEGRIRLESSPEQGTKVEIRLPIESRIGRIVPLTRLNDRSGPAVTTMQGVEEEAAQDAGPAHDPAEPREAQA